MKPNRMRVVSVAPVVALVNEDESRSFTGYENHIIARGLSLLYSVLGEHPGRLTYSQACDVVRWCEGGAL